MATKMDTFNWDLIDQVIGEVPDTAIAEATGIAQTYIWIRRQQLGRGTPGRGGVSSISPWNLPVVKELLGDRSLTNEEIAKRIDVHVDSVKARRILYQLSRNPQLVVIQ